MTLQNHQRDALIRLRALRGPALSILVAMLIAGPEHRFMARDLETWTGYSSDAVSNGLRTLTLMGAAIDHGRRRGWSLHPGWHQLPLTFGGMKPVDNPVDNSGSLSAGDDLSPEKPDSVLVNENLSPEKPDSNWPAVQLNPEKPDSNGVNGHLSPEKPDSNCDRSMIVDRSYIDTGSINQSIPDSANLIERLEALRPPFQDAAQFVTEHPPALIAAWLDYIETQASRAKLESESALLARRVAQRKHPPRPRTPKREHIPAEYADIIKR